MNKVFSKKSSAIKDSREDKILYTVVNVVLFLFILIVAYPLIYVVSSSFSSGTAVTTGRVTLLPVDFSLEGYKTVFSHKLILSAYRNTLFYTVAGTLINILVHRTHLLTYPEVFLQNQLLPHSIPSLEICFSVK